MTSCGLICKFNLHRKKYFAFLDCRWLYIPTPCFAYSCLHTGGPDEMIKFIFRRNQKNDLSLVVKDNDILVETLYWRNEHIDYPFGRNQCTNLQSVRLGKFIFSTYITGSLDGSCLPCTCLGVWEHSSQRQYFSGNITEKYGSRSAWLINFPATVHISYLKPAKNYDFSPLFWGKMSFLIALRYQIHFFGCNFFFDCNTTLRFGNS